MCPRISLLNDLPVLSTNLSGWPWTDESKPLCPLMPDGQPWPKISIITPSFNQGKFIEETIRSVLLQNYPNLEYIIIDGGSTDNTVEIIKKYEPWLTYWLSEKDDGQTAAINKGLKHVTGQIVAYLNSDDVYLPGAFYHAGNMLNDGRNGKWLVGSCQMGEHLNDNDLYVKQPYLPDPPWRCLLKEYCLPQPSVFLRKECIDTFGCFDEALHYGMDYDYWCRLVLNGYYPKFANEPLSFFRIHKSSKTSSMQAYFEEEYAVIIARYMPLAPDGAKHSINSMITQSINLHHHFTAREIRRTKNRLAAMQYLIKMAIGRPSMVFMRAMLSSLKRLVY